MEETKKADWKSIALILLGIILGFVAGLIILNWLTK